MDGQPKRIFVCFGLKCRNGTVSSKNWRHDYSKGMISSRQQQCFAWIFCLILRLFPGLNQGLSVQFSSEEPVYAIPNQVLVLEARIGLAIEEQLAKVIWEKEGEDGTPPGKVKVAEIPEKALDPRISIEQQGATLRVLGFGHEDRGIYTVTVTSKTGTRKSAARIVREYVAVHHVTVAIEATNASHSLLLCREAWGTEPQYSWLHEGAVLGEEEGQVSTNGMELRLSAQLCGHFTCVVSNRLGHSSATYTAEPCQRQGAGATVGVVFLIVIVTGGVLGFLVWRRHRMLENKAERLHETTLEGQL
ncbi:hypothetical protein GJAV_G00002650 [Gymnothorax javanicus]|nr:hypothetical protein GJAV_G00002650 [Gymnothorax javanicus]